LALTIPTNKKKGASSTCYVISQKSDFDGKQMLLEKALDELEGSGFGTIICCIPSKLLYWEGESPGMRYVIEKTIK
jgi:hypothetical protein